MNIMGSTLLPYGKYPLVIKRPGIFVRFPADYDQPNLIEPSGKVYPLKQRLAYNVFMLDRKSIENRKPPPQSENRKKNKEKPSART